MGDTMAPFHLSRRQMVRALGGGLGLVALADALSAAPRAPHFAPKAKRIIHLFMNGGPFQCDLFDPKPELNKQAGKKPPGADLRTERPTGALMAANTQLDTRRAFTEAVLSSVTAGVVAMDAENRILLINRSAESLLQHQE